MRQMLMITGLASVLMAGAAVAPTFAQMSPQAGAQTSPEAGNQATPPAGLQGGRPPVATPAGPADQPQANGAGMPPRPGRDFGPGFGPRPPMGRPPFPGAFPPPMRPGMPFAAPGGVADGVASGVALAAKLAAAETYVGITPDQLGAWRAYTTALIAFSEPPSFGPAAGGDHGPDKAHDLVPLPGEGMADGLIAAAGKAKVLKSAIDGLKAALKPEQLRHLTEMAPILSGFGAGPHGGPDGGPERGPHPGFQGRGGPHGPMPGGFFDHPDGFRGDLRPMPPGAAPDDNRDGAAPDDGAQDPANPDHG